VPVTIEPKPPDDERDAILAALSSAPAGPSAGWSATALLEGVEGELDDP
jgi:hypothetical protein